MEFIRRSIQIYLQLITDANEYIPRGRNLVEAELKLACYRSLIQCATLVSKYSIFILIFGPQTGRSLYSKIFIDFSNEISFIDFYFIIFVLLYFVLLGAASALLEANLKYTGIFFYIVLVILAISVGELFEFGWFFSTGKLLRYPNYCNVCGNRFQDLFLIPCFHFYQVYVCTVTIYNCIHAYLQLRDHQKMLDSLPKFKFNTVASKGG